MQSLSKTNSIRQLKRLVSILICLMMFSATFPIHMLKNTVWAAKENTPITIDFTPNTVGWKTNSNRFYRTLTNATDLTDDIIINITDNIELDIDKFPRGGYLFNFTDEKFQNKTITINGNSKTIKITNSFLYFLNMRDCNVALNDLTIDGGYADTSENSVTRFSAFISVEGLDSKLEVGKNVTIQNCKNQGQFNQDASGGAIYAKDFGTINFNGKIEKCFVEGGQGKAGKGGAICSSGVGTINFDGNITNCSATGGTGFEGKAGNNGADGIKGSQDLKGQPGGNGDKGGNGGNAYGGVIYLSGNGTINFNGQITQCSAIGGSGGSGGSGGKGVDGDGFTFDGFAGGNGGNGGNAGNAYGGAIYVDDGGTIIVSQTIQNCSASMGSGGAGGNGGNGGNKYKDSSREGENGSNGAAGNDGYPGNGGNGYGGAIYNNAGTVILHDCTVQNNEASGKNSAGDAIYNKKTLRLPPKNSNCLTIQLPQNHNNSSAGHQCQSNNNATQSGYSGIFNDGGIITLNSYQISLKYLKESGDEIKTSKLNEQHFEDERITIPEIEGYTVNKLQYGNDKKFTAINNNYQFKLTRDIIQTASIDSVIQLQVICSEDVGASSNTVNINLSYPEAVRTWMDRNLSGDNLQNVKKINITITDDITIENPPDGSFDVLPTMTNSSYEGYLFDFTDERFADKTITINADSQKTIKITRANLFFLNMKDCKVILNNITIDGDHQIRQGAFINMAKSETEHNSELEINQNVTIQNCTNQATNSLISKGESGKNGKTGARGANGAQGRDGSDTQPSGYYGQPGSDGGHGINGGHGAGGCIGNTGCGGAIYCGAGTITINGEIVNCSAIGGNGGQGGNGGNGGQGGTGSKDGLMGSNGNNGSSGREGAAGEVGSKGAKGQGCGGAIYNDGELTLKNATIDECSADNGAAIYNASNKTDAINFDSTSETKTTIQQCTALENGGAIYNDGGTVTIKGGNIANCSSEKQGDAIYNNGTLYLTPTSFNLFTITLPTSFSNNKHNQTLSSPISYNGIYTDAESGGITVCQFCKINFSFKNSSNQPLSNVAYENSDKLYFVGDSIDMPSLENYVIDRLEYSVKGNKKHIDANFDKIQLTNELIQAIDQNGTLNLTAICSDLPSTAIPQGQNHIDINLSTPGDVRRYMYDRLRKSNVEKINNINITLTKDITIDNSSEFIPTMSNSLDGNRYLFDFTADRFAGKTITIKANSPETININRPDLCFLNMKNCKVILENITIDGGNQSRQGAFINLAKPRTEHDSELEIKSNVTIQNCKNQGSDGADALGGAIYADGNVAESDIETVPIIIITLNGKIQNCQAIGGNGGNGAGYLDNGDGANGGNGGDGCGGAISAHGDVIINVEGTINSCQAIGGNGGRGANALDNGDGANGGNGGNGGRGKGGAIFYEGTNKVKIQAGQITNCLSVYGDGGDGGNGGTGGNEDTPMIANDAFVYYQTKDDGSLKESYLNQFIVKSRKKGGNGGNGGHGARGGNGGNANATAGNYESSIRQGALAIRPDFDGVLGETGGDGGYGGNGTEKNRGGTGGKGGLGGNGQGMAPGGNGGKGGNGGIGGNGGDGGNGGTSGNERCVAMNFNNIFNRGGRGGDGGNGNNGGKGGNGGEGGTGQGTFDVSNLSPFGSMLILYLASGGDGGKGGNSSKEVGQGGNGGNSELVNATTNSEPVAVEQQEKTKSVKIEDSTKHFADLQKQSKANKDTERWYQFSEKTQQLWKKAKDVALHIRQGRDVLRDIVSESQKIADKLNINISFYNEEEQDYVGIAKTINNALEVEGSVTDLAVDATFKAIELFGQALDKIAELFEEKFYVVNSNWEKEDYSFNAAQGGKKGENGKKTEKEERVVEFFEENGGGGGAICIESGELILMNGKIEQCSSNERGSSIFIGARVWLNFSNDFTIVPAKFVHPNDPTRQLSVEDLKKYYDVAEDKTSGKPGIYLDSHFRQLYYKLVFVNADNPSEKLYVQDIEGAQNDMNVPDKPGYKINSLIFKYGDGILTQNAQNGKFNLTLDIIKNSVKNWVITCKVKYDKLYTINYICDNELIRSKKDQIIDASNVGQFNPLTLASIDENFRKATEPNLGYEFSKITYGRDNVEILEEGLDYDNLIRQADDNVITFMINHAPKQYSLEYVDENKNALTVKDLEGDQASSQQVKFGDDIKTMAPNDEKLGYDFKCWHVMDKNGNELKEKGKPIDLETAKASWETLAKAADDNNTIKLKAVYTPKKYIIKYNTRSDKTIADKEFYIGKDKGSQLSQEISKIYLPNTTTNRYPGKSISNKYWKYGAYGPFNETNKPTWGELIKSALLDEDGNNLIILEAVYQ